MTQTPRLRFSAVGLLVALFSFVFFAAADDPSTDIPIVCPSSVSAGSTIFGYAIEYTPPVYLSATNSSGAPIPVQSKNPFASNRCDFAIPTLECMAGDFVFIQANDAAGQTGFAACFVTY